MVEPRLPLACEKGLVEGRRLVDLHAVQLEVVHHALSGTVRVDCAALHRCWGRRNAATLDRWLDNNELGKGAVVTGRRGSAEEGCEWRVLVSRGRCAVWSDVVRTADARLLGRGQQMEWNCRVEFGATGALSVTQCRTSSRRGRWGLCMTADERREDLRRFFVANLQFVQVAAATRTTLKKKKNWASLNE